ncbi:MAG TPA: toll/interleukin-1 receptor domain-containing protein, partial [Thermoanaerobaculia bacterium]
MPESFDVFLSHNSKGKPAVRALAAALRDRGLNVWLDEDNLLPGQRWQEELEKIIKTARAGAVLVGGDGFGPWEDQEMRALLSQAVQRRIPIIPVLLPGAAQTPDLPLFLAEFKWPDLRGGFAPSAIDLLAAGIRQLRKAARPMSDS